MSILNKSELHTQANSTLPDNSVQSISPADVRDMINNIIDSSLNAVDDDINTYVRTAPTKVTVGGIPQGQIPNYDHLQDLFDAIFYPFTQPTISLGSSSLHEKGLTINKSMTYSITLNDGIVSDKKIFLDSVLATTLTANSGTYNSSSGLTWSNSLSPSLLYYSHTFNLKVNFTNSTQLNSNILVEFASPTYHGVLNISDVDETHVKALTKVIRKKANDSNLTFNPTLQRYIYAYPTIYGDLASIIDQNGFNVTAGFTKSTVTYTLADSTTESYNVYVSNNDTTQTNFKLTFNFS
jgi:hypothetical protein